MRIPIATQSGAGRSLPLGIETLVNMYAEQAPTGGKSTVVLHGTPGLKSFGSVTGPCRGMLVMDGVLYVVGESALFSVDSAGTATNLGGIPSSIPVDLSHNGTELVITNGTVDYLDGYFIFGGGVTWGYVYDTTNGLRDISAVDPDFPVTSNSGSFFISSLLSGTTFDALDFATAESHPDPLKRVFVDHREVWLFGARSIEIWYNAGAADFPFVRISGAVIDEYGLLTTWAVEKLDNSVVWLASDATVRKAGQGYVPVRISTHAVEYDIAKLIDQGNIDQARSMRYRQEGHEFYVLNLPGVATWVFDAASQQWHKRKSHERDDWRVRCYAKAYDKHIVGDVATGTLWQMDLDTPTEGTDPLIAELIPPVMHNEGNRFQVHELYMDFEPGVGVTAGQGEDPQVMVSWSRDGKSWSTHEEWRSLGHKGTTGTRPIIRRLGQHRYLYLRIRISDPVKLAAYALYARIEGNLS